MERIERKYAVIYVDRQGLSLAPHADNFTPNEVVSKYFEDSGFLQWNYYLIIPEECVLMKEVKETIENNGIYTRKYVVPSEDIDKFIEDRFPELPEKINFNIKLIKGKDWEDAKRLGEREKCNVYYPSFHRDHSLYHTLEEIDKLRASFIKLSYLNSMSNFTIVFYTHFTNEYSLLEKKFALFLK